MNNITTIGGVTNITVTRGDSLYLAVSMVKDGQPYTPAEGDVVFFSAENGAGLTVFGKTIPTDSLVLSIYPEDTRALHVGTYKYNIRLITAAGDVDTFVRGKLRIEKEVA